MARSPGLDALLVDCFKELGNPPYMFVPPMGTLDAARLFRGLGISTLTVPDLYDRRSLTIYLSDAQYDAIAAALPSLPREDLRSPSDGS